MLQLVSLTGEAADDLPTLVVTHTEVVLRSGEVIWGQSRILMPDRLLRDELALAIHHARGQVLRPVLQKLPDTQDTLLLAFDARLPSVWVAATLLAIPTQIERVGLLFTDTAADGLAPDMSPLESARQDDPSLASDLDLMERVWAPCPAGWRAQATLFARDDLSELLTAIRDCGCHVDLDAARALHYTLRLGGLQQHTVRWVRLSQDAGLQLLPSAETSWKTWVQATLPPEAPTTPTAIHVVQPAPPPPPPPPKAPD